LRRNAITKASIMNAIVTAKPIRCRSVVLEGKRKDPSGEEIWRERRISRRSP
jgi:hypothetical protein